MALTPAQARAAADAKLTPLWGAIQTRQAAYLAARGRYAQVLITNTVLPADGDELAPDRLDVKPGYQVETTRDLWPAFPATLPFAVEITQYVTPDGTPGFVATALVKLGVQVWARAMQIGPETQRQYGWQRVADMAGDV